MPFFLKNGTKDRLESHGLGNTEIIKLLRYELVRFEAEDKI